MKVENAAGQKTDRFERAQRRYEAQLEAQLELLTDAMRGSVTRADAVNEAKDEYGHHRDSHIGHAVKIGAVSAQIVTALGKLDGAFNHNINIKRASEDAVPTRYVVETNSNPKIRKVYPSREAYEQARAAFERSITPYPLPPEPWRADSYDTGDAAFAANMDEAEDDEAETDAEGVPPSENSGSND